MFTSKRTLLRTIERMTVTHAAQIDRLLEINARLAGKPLPPPVKAPASVRPEKDGDGFMDV
jgi:hypothetical protein